MPFLHLQVQIARERITSCRAFLRDAPLFATALVYNVRQNSLFPLIRCEMVLEAVAVEQSSRHVKTLSLMQKTKKETTSIQNHFLFGAVLGAGLPAVVDVDVDGETSLQNSLSRTYPKNAM